MNCPKCEAKMEDATYSGLTVHRCTGCQGLWFGQTEFQSLKKDDWLSDHIDIGEVKKGLKQDKIRGVNCPECDSRMKSQTDKEQPHILYEECTNGCGVYFDAGEFKDLAKTTFWDKLKTRKVRAK